MKTRITDLRENAVELEFDTLDGGRRTLTIWAPRAGGYVRVEEWDNRQICERLESQGNTLEWYPSDHKWHARKYPRLIDLVRAEYRAAKRAE